MALTAEQIHDLAVNHRVGLSRYSTHVVRRMLALLNKTLDDVAGRLARTDNESVSGQRLEALITELRGIQRAGWTVIEDRLRGNLTDLAGAEAKFALRLAGVSIEPRAVAMFSPLPPIEQIMAAVNSRPFQGRFLKDWFTEAEEGGAKLVRDTVRQGFIEGRPTADIVRAIRGTKAQQYRDGVMEMSRRRAEAMVRTALTHTANTAAQAAWEANADIVTAWRFVATLDARTTLICAGLHGKKFPLGKGPQPPRHVNCRSTSVPVLPEIDGVAPFEFPSYEAWLKKQSPKRQADILGASRAALFRTGGLKVDRFTDHKGKVLTLAELRARDAEGFKEAGLDLPLKPPRGQPQDEIARFLANPVAQRALMERLLGSAGAVDREFSVVRSVAARQGWKAQEPDMASIRFYTGSGYRQINTRMRESGGTLEDRQFSSLASRGVGDLPDEPGEVWRAPRKQMAGADSLWSRAVVGQELDLGDQLQSFSRSKSFAARWSGGADVLLHVRKPKGAAYIEPLSINPGEDEVLFRLGLRYKVVELRAETVNGRPYRVIELEVAD